MSTFQFNETSAVGSSLSTSNGSTVLNSSQTQETKQQTSSFSVDSKLVQYFYILIICSISLVFLLRFYAISRKGYARLSKMLRMHLYTWICCMINNVTYVIPVIYFWGRTDQDYNMFWAALRGSANSAGMITVPLSTLWITLDRVYALTFPLQIKRPLRLRLQMLCIALLILTFLIITYIGFVRTWEPEEKTTHCITYGCLLLKTDINDLIRFKITTSYVNILFGVIFVVMYFRFGRKLTGRREQKKNLIMILLLISEFLFNVIPCTLYLYFFDKNVSFLKINLTSILMPSYCTDGFLTSLVFYRTWSEKLLSRRVIRVNAADVQLAQSRKHSSAVTSERSPN